MGFHWNTIITTFINYPTFPASALRLHHRVLQVEEYEALFSKMPFR